MTVHDSPRDDDDPLRELRAELTAVTPSPEFAANVRARIGRPRWRRMAWPALAAGAASLALVAAGAIGLRPARPVPVTPAVGTPAAGVIPAARTVAAPSGEGSASQPAVARRARRGAVRGEPARVAAPAVVVSADELRALQRLLRAVKAGRLVPSAAERIGEDPETGELLPPDPVVVPPLKIEPLPAGRDGGEGRRNR